ncbi:MAG: hypothetical protein QOF45_1166 [Gaiellaceae bacterium]|jgi:hypothetical protein|nr:hypothetical protein [Gaiellaceae bacterium]
MRNLAVICAAFAFAPALAGAAGQQSPVSGLHGIVKRGPTTPVCQVGKPCEGPAVGVVLEFSRSGVLKARVKTDRAGAYTVRLRPGSYVVTVSPRRLGSGLRPRAVRVPSGRLAKVDFFLDTGIR